MRGRFAVKRNLLSPYRNGVVTKWVIFIYLFFLFRCPSYCFGWNFESTGKLVIRVLLCIGGFAYLFDINFHLFQLLLRSNSRGGFHYAVMSGTSLNIYVIRPCVV